MSNRTNRPTDTKNTKERQQYHIKTRHYAKADAYPHEDQIQISTEKEKITKQQKYDKVDKYDRYERFQKTQDYSRSPYSRDQADASFSEGNKLGEGSMNAQKKENARNRGFEMRVNNIQNLHDKITNLLNLVKNDAKINNLNNNKIKDSYGEFTQQNQFGKQEWKDKIKKAAIYNYDAKENLTTTEQKYKIKIMEQSNRDYQRNRAASAMNIQRPKQKANNSILPKNKYLYNNPQDKIEQPLSYADLQFKKYKPNPNHKWQEKSKELDDRSKSKQNNTKIADKDKPSYTNALSPRVDNKQTEKRMGRIIKEKKKDPQQQRLKDIQPRQTFEQTNSVIGKWNNYYETEQQHSSKQSTYKYERPSPQSKKIQQSILPMTLLSNTTNERPENATNTTRMIDEQIKRIKNKIQQSQSHNYRMQQRLTLDQNETTTAKKNKVGSLTPTNKFQLKVYPVEIDKEQTVRIAEMLSNQAQIDSRMRVARQKFNSNSDQNKWKELQYTLKTRGIKITGAEIKQLITLSPDQHNPFGESQSSTPKNSDLVELFCAAQQHWQTKLCGCSSLKALKAQGFEAGDMDLNKKGYLQVEDIVCFVNLYTGHFYRNRDIALIYRRLLLLQGSKCQEGVQSQTFMRIVAL